MRQMKNPQLHFGEVNIANIYIDARSHDDVPAILKGLQYIDTQDAARKKVFRTLEAIIDPSVRYGIVEDFCIGNRKAGPEL